MTSKVRLGSRIGIVSRTDGLLRCSYNDVGRPPPLFRGISHWVQGALIRIDEIFHRRGHRRLRLRDIGQVLFHRPTAAERPEEPDERSEEHTSELQSPYDLVCRL